MKFFRLLMRAEGERETPAQVALSITLALAAFAAFFLWSLNRLHITLDFSFLSTFRIRLGKGFATTVALSVASLICSLVLGFATALGNRSRFLPLSYLCKTYVQFIRGTPLIMQIYLFFYIVGTAWGVTNRFLSGVIILSLFEGAYISEIIRGSLDSVSGAQIEAAKAVGLEKRQIMRLIVVPQLVARTLPALAGQFASIIKDSSLLSIISVIELAQTVREISATNFAIFECYIFLGLLYLALTFPLSMLTRRLERRFRYEN